MYLHLKHNIQSLGRHFLHYCKRIEEEVYLQTSVRQYWFMWTYKYNITQNKT